MSVNAWQKALSTAICVPQRQHSQQTGVTPRPLLVELKLEDATAWSHEHSHSAPDPTAMVKHTLRADRAISVPVDGALYTFLAGQ